MINLEFKLNQTGGTLFFVRLSNDPNFIDIDMQIDPTGLDVKNHLRALGHNIDTLKIKNVTGIERIIEDDKHLYSFYGLKKEGYIDAFLSVKLSIEQRLIDATFKGTYDDVNAILTEAGDIASDLIMNIRDLNDLSKTLIHYAARIANYNKLILFRTKIGEDNFRQLVNVVDNENRTPLMFICRGGAGDDDHAILNTINILLDNMNDKEKNSKDRNNNSALKYAINNHLSNDAAQAVYEAVDPQIDNFIEPFFETGIGITKLVREYDSNHNFLLDKFMTDFVKIDWETLISKIKLL